MSRFKYVKKCYVKKANSCACSRRKTNGNVPQNSTRYNGAAVEVKIPSSDQWSGEDWE